jgi:putative endonuclease
VESSWRRTIEPDHHRRLGKVGEEAAARFLIRRGVRILARNREVAGGEVDLVVRVGRERAVVEVRSVWAEPGPRSPHPLAAFDADKAIRVQRLAKSLGIRRVDLVAVRFHRAGVDVHWVPRVA